MSAAPNPEKIYDRAKEEGRRRLAMPLMEQVATGFIAGITVVFGIVALGIVESMIGSEFSDGVASFTGALAFGIGVVFLVVGRSELFSENFFDPVAAAIDEGGASVWARLAELWTSTLLLNLVGGGILLAMLTVDGALPEGAVEPLVHAAEDIASKTWEATLVRAVLAGALITLMSYMLSACDSVAARIFVSFIVGFLLALGPFDHVVVSGLHLLFGVWESGDLTYSDAAKNLGLATAGNLGGGLFLMTFTHAAQMKVAD